ncbi:MAG: choice-of-anchor D domain-containing protein, partial [Planctomycetota bacterium]
QLDFGRVAVGGEASVELAIENTGLRDLVVRGWSVSGTDAAAFSVDSGDLVVAPGTTERRSVRLRPQAMGPHAAELALVTNDPAQPSVRVDLRGEGASPPVLRVRVDGQSSGATGGSANVQALSFPDTRRTRQSTLDLVIENGGGADLHVTQIRLDGKNAADFQIDASPAIVVAGARLVRTVTFAPLAEGQREATLTLVTDDPNAASYGVTLEGTGLEAPRPLAVLVTPSLTFPSTSTDRPVRRELRVRNDGSDTLSLTAAQLDGAQAAVFGVVLESTSVAPGEEVAVPVTFHPTRAGRYEASVRIATDDPDSPELVASLQGAALARSSGGGGGGCRLAPGSGCDTGILPIVLALLALAGWRRRDG